MYVLKCHNWFTCTKYYKGTLYKPNHLSSCVPEQIFCFQKESHFASERTFSLQSRFFIEAQRRIVGKGLTRSRHVRSLHVLNALIDVPSPKTDCHPLRFTPSWPPLGNSFCRFGCPRDFPPAMEVRKQLLVTLASTSHLQCTWGFGPFLLIRRDLSQGLYPNDSAFHRLFW